MRLSFNSYLRLKEDLGFNMDSPEAESAVMWLMRRYHGWPEENVRRELFDPNFAMKLMRKFRLNPHGEPYEVIQTVAQQFGLPSPKMLG